MASRYFPECPREKLTSKDGWSTKANNDYPGGSTELRSFEKPGKGAPMQDKKAGGKGSSKEDDTPWERVWP